jgi:hypothetical protein
MNPGWSAYRRYTFSGEVKIKNHEAIGTLRVGSCIAACTLTRASRRLQKRIATAAPLALSRN